jgi:hypothetical protein
MRVTIETTIGDERTIAEFWSMYQTAFAPLARVAATKQTMTEVEFRSLMAEETVLKFVGWDRNGDPAAMLILATDLRHVSWISQEFYESRYPEQAARKAIFYVVAALVRPTARGSLWFRAVLLESIKYAASRRGVGCIDCCQHNVENVQIPRIVDRLSASVAEVEPQEIDTQSYYAYVYHGLKEHLARPAIIDITDDAVRRAEASARSAAHRGVPTS